MGGWRTFSGLKRSELKFFLTHMDRKPALFENRKGCSTRQRVLLEAPASRRQICIVLMVRRNRRRDAGATKSASLEAHSVDHLFKS